MEGLPPPRIDLLVHSPAPSTLVPVLQQLLEPSPPLSTLLAPELHAYLQSLPPNQRPTSYKDLLDVAQALVEDWDIEEQAAFLASHPRIGETKGLSSASEGEQAPKAGQGATPGEVLKRLQILNAFYEETFPGLRYVTFVNGRTRAEIVPELESLLSLHLPPPSASTPEPRLGDLRRSLRVQPTGSSAWRDELKRGLGAMWDIARNRVASMGAQ
ncbi:hypothetical protein JCM5296_002594 [Sporobolomyces johnsonii]